MSETLSLVAGLILERPLCVDCIALKASVTGGAVEGYLATLATGMNLRRENGACRACGLTTLVASTGAITASDDR